MAMYDAKEQGRDRLSVDPSPATSSRSASGPVCAGRSASVTRWRTRDGFVLYEQPIARLVETASSTGRNC